jgi:hypothetical protein
MASTAERQAAYRRRRAEGDGDKRLNTWISASASAALERLAKRHATTQRAMLERLILAADSAPALDVALPPDPAIRRDPKLQLRLSAEPAHSCGVEILDPAPREPGAIRSELARLMFELRNGGNDETLKVVKRRIKELRHETRDFKKNGRPSMRTIQPEDDDKETVDE